MEKYNDDEEYSQDDKMRFAFYSLFWFVAGFMVGLLFIFFIK